MISAWTIYFIGSVDRIHTALCPVALTCFLAWIVCLVGAGVNVDCHYESEKRLFSAFSKWAKRFFYSSIVFAFIVSAIPSSKTLAAMYVIPAIVNNEKLQAIGSNSLEILENLTGKWLQELEIEKPKKKETRGDI